MSLEKPRPRRASIAAEEERAWIDFYRRVGRDPAIATEVLAQLESDPEMKRLHLALYLCCREALRLHEARRMRNQRLGETVRRLCQALFVRPLHGVQIALHRGGDIVAACLPGVGTDSAHGQVRRLMPPTEPAHLALSPAPASDGGEPFLAGRAPVGNGATSVEVALPELHSVN